jgi:hypothetical protein
MCFVPFAQIYRNFIVVDNRFSYVNTDEKQSYYKLLASKHLHSLTAAVALAISSTDSDYTYTHTHTHTQKEMLNPLPQCGAKASKSNL